MSTPTVNPSPAVPSSASSPNGDRTHTPATNGAAPASSRLPKAAPLSFIRRRLGLLLLGGGALAVAGFIFFLSIGKAQTYDGPTAVAKKKRLQVTIVERGTLESAENSDIICRVRATTKGSSTATHIKWVIADGTPVERGEKLIELDDSSLQEQLRDQKNEVAKARAAWVAAKQNLLITLSQNFSDLETAKTEKILAEIELRIYVGEVAARKLSKIRDREELQDYLGNHLAGDFAAAEKRRDNVSEFFRAMMEIEGKIEIARADQEMWLDRAAWSQRMVKRGLLMRSQADSDKFRLESATITMRNVQAELDILRQFSLEKEVTDRWSKVLEAERALDRVKTQNQAQETLGESEVESTASIYEQALQKQREIEDDIRKCTIYSPQDGMVVYFAPESSRYRSDSNQNLVQEGEPVREGQKLMQIPNLHKMLVNTRVHEAMVQKIRGETFKPTGFSDAVRGGMVAAQPELSGLAGVFAYNLEAREHYRDFEKTLDFGGEPAVIKVDAFPTKKYNGYVKSVATVASQASFLSSDVKVYQTMVALDGSVERLKPGMSAEVAILAKESGGEVLVVPIQAIVGSLSSGEKRKCFVVDERGRPKERDIVVGTSNDKEAEVLSGLNEGEKVALNPRVLLGDKSELKAVTPRKQRGGGDVGGKQGGKKDGGGGPGRTDREDRPNPEMKDGGGGSVDPAFRKKD